MCSYYLRRDVYLSITGTAGVLLDLRSGDYVGLSAAQMCSLGTIVQGWPAPSANDSLQLPPDQHETQQLADSMLKSGLFTEDAAEGKGAEPIALDAVEERLLDRDGVERPRIRFRHVVRFIQACAVAKLSLRFRTVGEILKSVAARKSRYSRAFTARDYSKAQDLLNVFFHIRPLIYASKDQCLFDSFVLVEFLARYDIYPQWVLGVKTDPFAAHSWIQHEKFVLNGAPHAVQRFSPIVAV